ncbi:CcmD family protein [Filimonas effusa]|uniref:CcmD family protein n=1 Tax=Filimonas effusa TaxID=2508721 RepID=A0A4Q1DEL6_9BACT|nr:CcmD family protein [Filimonas effusa]RXK87133.1 CcmD family protein [Filimonas effusa]
MDKIRRIAVMLAGCFMSLAAMAQEVAAPAAENDLMRSNGKLYVVVAVVVTIVTGIFIYLLNLDRKISRLEKELSSK